MNDSPGNPESGLPGLATAQTACGWKIRAAIAAITAALKRVRIAGTFLTMRTPVITGTTRSHGVILKADRSDCENSAAWDTSAAGWRRLAIRNIIRATVSDGIVVIIIYLIWVKSGVPLEEDASTVVSERGDTLSPK